MFPNIEGFVLTGGASSRMGTDKSRLEFDGENLAARAVRALQHVCPRVSMVGGEPMEGIPFISDQIELYGDKRRAPILGVHAALKNSNSGWCAILACDLPFVSPDLLYFLAIKTVELNISSEVVVPIQPDGRLQPLCALYRTETCLSAVETAIASNDLSLTNLLETIETLKIDLENFNGHVSLRDPFLNINTPGDFQKALETALRD